MEMNFSFIKDCLLIFNYPLAHSMSDEELGDIFKPSNRGFLISWMLKLLDSTYEEVLENSENDKEILGNMVYELGFCTQKEKVPFMTGELPVGEQVKIIFNMFTFITDIKKCDVEENKNVVSNDELADLINTNLNLFPMYGDIKVLKPSEKSKVLVFQNEIFPIQKEDSKYEISMENKTETYSLFINKFNYDIEESLEKLLIEFPKIVAVKESFNKNQNAKTNDAIKLHPNSAELLHKCGRDLKMISQFIKDINIIQEFINTKTEINASNKEKINDIYDMLQMLYQEIISVRKYARCL